MASGISLWRSIPSRFSEAFDLKGFVFALFLSSGYLKADPRLAWVPADLTILTALWLAGLVLRPMLTDTWQKGLWVVFGLVAILLPSALWTDWHPYAAEKLGRFLALTLLASVAPFFLIRRPQDIRRFFNAFLLVGTTMAIDALLQLPSVRDQWVRLTAFGSGPLNLGRATGAALVWALVLWLGGRGSSVATLGLAAVLGFTTFASGSRGPLISASVALMVFVLKGGFPRERQIWLRLGVLILLLGTIGVFGDIWAPAGAAGRVRSLLTGHLEDLSRLELYSASFHHIQTNPLGIGWGGFVIAVDYWTGQIRQYPHNVFIEVFLEQGWLAGFFLVVMVAGVFIVALRRSNTFEARSVLAMLTFFFLNAMVTGDLNDNRAFFALAFLALVRPAGVGSPKPAHFSSQERM